MTNKSYQIQLQEAIETLTSFEIRLQEITLNLIKQNELSDWNKEAKTGGQIELHDEFFEACEDENVKIIWLLVKQVRLARQSILV